MERERLTRLLEDPARITRQDLADLVSMAERYPWFSGAQLLRAAGERLGGEVLSDETLRTAGAHLPSRAALFDLTSDHASRPRPPLRVVRAEEPVVETSSLLMEALPERVAETVAPMPPKPLVQAPIVVLEPEAGPTPSSQPEPIPVVLRTPEPVTEVRREVTTGTVDDLELQILENAVAGAYDLTVLEQLPEALSPPTPETKAIAQEPIPVQLDRNARLRFSDWLDASENSTPVLEAPRPPAPKASAHERLDTSSLIDRFIRQETPEPKRTAFFTPQQAGKRSLDDSAGLVTETLARIYARQGNTAKAIEAYRRLALKYPDKSSYFAALSKELENQQNT